jgi:hypothetical protein
MLEISLLSCSVRPQDCISTKYFERHLRMKNNRLAYKLFIMHYISFFLSGILCTAAEDAITIFYFYFLSMGLHFLSLIMQMDIIFSTL